MAKYSKVEVEQAMESLRSRLKPGDTVYTTVSNVSQSGMSRHIKCYIINGNEVNNITYWVARVCGDRISPKTDGLVISGCGMDMGFAVVYNLGRVMFPDGFAPSNIAIRPEDGKQVNVDCGRGIKHSKEVPFSLDKAAVEGLRAKGWKFIGGRNGDESGWDNDGGYALRQRWM